MNGILERMKLKNWILIGISIIFGIILLSLYGFLGNSNKLPLRTVDEVCLELEREEGNYNENHIVVRDMPERKLKALSKELNAEYKATKNGDFAVLYLNSEFNIEQVCSNENYRDYVGYMQPDYYGKLCSSEEAYVVDKSKFSTFSYVCDALNLGDTWNTTRGAGTSIAIIDTGIDIQNEYLQSKISPRSYNASEGKIVSDYDLSIIDDGDTDHQHGTAVASIIAADYNSSVDAGGFAPDTELVVIKLNLDTNGRISATDVIFALAYAIECDVDVVNMSFAFDYNIFGNLLSLANDSDVICVAAAGDGASSANVWPASDDNVIGVGSVKDTLNNGDEYFSAVILGGNGENFETTYNLGSSNYGENVDIMALNQIATVSKGNGLEGTSASCAMVSASIALYQSLNKNQEVYMIKDVLEASGKDLGTPGIDWYFGAGLLDIHALVVEDKGTITYDPLTDELEIEKHIFVKGHTLQTESEPERNYVVFDGWNYDINCLQEYDHLNDKLYENLTVYASWVNEDDTAAFSYYVKNDDTIEITGYLGKRRYIAIPSTIEEKVVTSIGNRAFIENRRIRHVELPDTLKEIGEYAFFNCPRLISVAIPGSVERIKDYAFSNCPSLGSVTFVRDGNLVSLGHFAFSEDGSISRIDLPSNLQEIDATTFSKASSLTTVTVDEKNSYLESDGIALYRNGEEKSLIFYTCGNSGYYEIQNDTFLIEEDAFAFTRINQVKLPTGLIKIGKEAFAYSGIEQINIPDLIIDIPDCCFYSCTSLRKISLGEKVSSIGNAAFERDAVLTEVIIDGELKQIGAFAFSECSGLLNIDFIAGVENIDAWAFNRCASISSVIIPKEISKMGDGVFCGCTSLETLIFEDGCKLTQILKWAFNQCVNLKTIILPEGLVEIGEICFAVSGLERIDIPSTVVSIGYGSFANCSNLTEINVHKNNKRYASIDGSLFEYDKNGDLTILHTYASGLEGEYIIPDNVITLADYAFCGTLNLTGVEFSEQVRSIGENCFLYSNISEALLNEGLENMGKGAFQSSRLQRVYIGSNLKKIEDNCFMGCTYLADVELAEGIVELGTQSFSSTKIQNIRLPKTLQTIGTRSFNSCSQLMEICIPQNVISIGAEAFDEDRALYNIYFEEGCQLSRIDYRSFANCGIYHFEIPASIKTIGMEAFSGCNNLESVRFAENSRLRVLTANIFLNTPALCSLEFSEGSMLEKIETRSLEYLTGLTSLDFSMCTSLKIIDNYALNMCKNINSIFLPEGLQEVGRYTFNGCQSLKKLVFSDSLDRIGRYAFANISDIEIYFNSAVLPENLEEFWDYGIRGYYLGSGETESNEEWVYSVLNDNTVVLLRYIGKQETVIVDTVDGHQVSALGADLLSENETLVSLELPETVLSLANYAFRNNETLKYIVLPASLQRIGSGAFENCLIEQIEIRDDSHLSFIDSNAFYRTTQLQTMRIPASVEAIRISAFEYSGIHSLIFEEQSRCKEIGRYAFAHSAFTKVVLPDSLEKIDYHAFEGNSNLTQVQFGNGKLQLYGYAFYNTGLTNITIPENLEYIGENCFAACSLLTEISVEENNHYYSSDEGVLFDKSFKRLIQYPASRNTTYEIPDDTEIIGFGAFEGSHVSSVQIGEESKLSTIGYRAFYDCEYLTGINIPKGIESIDYYAFAYCKRLQEVQISENSLLHGIYEGAFYNCESLRNIVIPDGVLEISDYAFYGCEKLQHVRINETSKLCGIFSHAFEYSGITEILLPESLFELGESAFAYTKLLDFTVEKSIKELEPDILYGCEQLQSLTVRNLADGEFKLSYLFGDKIPKSLQTVTITDTPNIPEGFMEGAAFVTNVIGDGMVESIGDNAFSECTSLQSINNFIPKTIGERSFYRCTSLVSSVDMKDVKTIGYQAFFACNSLEELIHVENVEIFGEECLAYCGSLQEVNLTGAIEIQNGAFNGSGLQLVVIGKKIKRVGGSSGERCYGVFDGCFSLKSVTIEKHDDGDSYTIEDSAFSNNSMEYAYLGDGLVSIGAAAFSGTALIEIELPDSLRTIMHDAFNNTPFLYGIILPDGLTNIEENAFGDDTIYHGEYYDKTRKVYIWIPCSVENVASNAFLSADLYLEGSEPPIYAIDDWIGDGSTVTCTYNAQKPYKEGDFLLIPAENGVSILKYLGDAPELTISDVISVPVIEVKGRAFEGNRTLHKIIFGDDLTTIGFRAFNRSSIQNVDCGNNLKIIGEHAFNCSSIQNIDCGNNLEIIGEYSFNECQGLTKINLGNQLSRIGTGAFAWCYQLGNLNLPETLKYIGGGFLCATSVEEVFLPEGLETIEQSAFINSRVGNIIIPSTVTEIGENAFAEASSLGSVIIKEGVKKIPKGCFSYCYGLEEIIIPDTVEEIGRDAFKNLPELNFLVIPDSVVRMEGGFNYNNADLTIAFVSDQLPEGLEEGWDSNIKEFVLGYTGNVVDEITGLQYQVINKEAYVSGYTGKLKKLSLDMINGYPIVEIAPDVFRNNDTLEDVTIGNNVRIMGQNVFAECSALKKVSFGENAVLKAIPESAFTECHNLLEINLPESVEKISAYAFYGTGLREIILPPEVKTLEPRAFYYSSIETADLSRCVKLNHIPELCFYCAPLKNVILPDNIHTIGNHAFGSSLLESINVPSALEALGGEAVIDCPACEHKDGLIYWGDVLIGYENDGRNVYTIPDYTKLLREGVFSGNTSVKSVEFMGNLDKIPATAFANCTSLETVIWPKELEVIESNAFQGCTSLNNVLLPASLKTLSSYVFVGCTSLAEIELPENLERIAQGALCGTSIKLLEIPERVVKIDQYALLNMESLESLSIPKLGVDGYTLYEMFGSGQINGWRVPNSLKTIYVTGNSEYAEYRDDQIDTLIFTGSVEQIEIVSDTLKNLKLPEKVNSLYLYMPMTEIDLPFTLKNLIYLSGMGDIQLQKLALPYGLESIGNINGQFTELEIPETVIKISEGALTGCTNLKELTLPITVSGNEYMYDSYNQLQRLFGIKWEWDRGSFPSGFNSLEKVTINGTPKILPDSYFKACYYLTEIVLPDTIETFGRYSLSECEQLEKINFPSALKEIKAGAIRKWRVKDIVLPDGIEYIWGDNFTWCYNLESFILTNEYCKNYTTLHDCPIKQLTIPFLGRSKDDYLPLRSLISYDNRSIEQVILLNTCHIEDAHAFDDILGVDIYCYFNAEGNALPTGWNNDNTVYYLNKWNKIDFLVDGRCVASTIRNIGDPVKLPARATYYKNPSSQCEYTFIGWDIDGDYAIDNLLTANKRGYIQANAVYQMTNIAAKSSVQAVNIGESENGEIILNGQSNKNDIMQTDVHVKKEELSLAERDGMLLHTDLCNIQFDVDALVQLSDHVDTSLKTQITKVSPNLLSGVSDMEAVYDFALLSGQEKIEFGNGFVEISVPYALGETENPNVAFVSEDGNMQFVPAVYNEINHTVIYKTNHFSLYKIGKESAETCSLSFDTDGGEFLEDWERPVGRILKLPVPVKEGRTFIAWVDSKGNKCYKGDSYTVSGTERFVAEYCDHQYGDWTISKEATCIDSGKREHVCIICGNVEYEEILTGNHVFVDGSCTICGEWKLGASPILDQEDNLIIVMIPNLTNVQEDGILYISADYVGDVSLDTLGRIRVRFTETEDNTYCFESSGLSNVKLCAYIIYLDENGNEQVSYSQQVLLN